MTSAAGPAAGTAMLPGHPASSQLEPPSAWAASAAFGCRTMLKIKHVPERLFAGQRMPPGLSRVRHLARHQVMGLASVFLLGMAVNLTGLPSQTRGAAHLASMAFLAGHVLIALGMVTGAILLLRATTRLGGRWHRQAIVGAAAIAVAVAAGILALMTSSTWSSYAMAVGFITALLAHGSLLLPATPSEQDNVPSSASDT